MSPDEQRDSGQLKWAIVPFGDGKTRVDMKWLVDADGNPVFRMCDICFEYVSIDDLYVDANGDKWSECKDCAATEKRRMETGDAWRDDV